MQPRMILAFFSLRLHFQLMFSLTPRTAKFFSAKVLPVLVHGVISLQVQNYVHCPISCVGTFLQPSEVSLNGSTAIWFTSHSSSFFNNLLRVHSIPLCRLLRKRYNIGPNIDSWDIPQLMGSRWTCVVDHNQQFSQFSLHLTVHLCSPSFISLSVICVIGDSVKSFTKVKKIIFTVLPLYTQPHILL